jgi:hypothetical protein
MAKSYMFPLWETNGTYTISQKEIDFKPEDFNDESTLYMFVLLYDLSRIDTLDYALGIFRKIKSEMRSNFMVYLVGNKSDLIKKEEVFNVREKIYRKMEENNIGLSQVFISLRQDKNRHNVDNLLVDFHSFTMKCKSQKQYSNLINIMGVQSKEERLKDTINELKS